MINRKCSRCKEITGTMHGGKKLRKNFYVKTVCKKELRAGNRIITSGTRKTSYLSIKILKITSVIYLIVSIITAFSAGAFIQIQGLVEYLFNNRYSWCYDNWIHIPVCSCILRIWVFILLVETVIKIYEK